MFIFSSWQGAGSPFQGARTPHLRDEVIIVAEEGIPVPIPIVMLHDAVSAVHPH